MDGAGHTELTNLVKQATRPNPMPPWLRVSDNAAPIPEIERPKACVIGKAGADELALAQAAADALGKEIMSRSAGPTQQRNTDYAKIQLAYHQAQLTYMGQLQKYFIDRIGNNNEQPPEDFLSEKGNKQVFLSSLIEQKPGLKAIAEDYQQELIKRKHAAYKIAASKHKIISLYHKAQIYYIEVQQKYKVNNSINTQNELVQKRQILLDAARERANILSKRAEKIIELHKSKADECNIKKKYYKAEFDNIEAKLNYDSDKTKESEEKYRQSLQVFVDAARIKKEFLSKQAKQRLVSGRMTREEYDMRFAYYEAEFKSIDAEREYELQKIELDIYNECKENFVLQTYKKNSFILNKASQDYSLNRITQEELKEKSQKLEKAIRAWVNFNPNLE